MVIRGGFGIFAGAYDRPRGDATDGADFTIVQIAPDGARTTLLRRHLDPVAIPTDRGTQEFNLRLPVRGTGQLEFQVGSGPAGNNAYDWTYWENLQFIITVTRSNP